MKKISDQEYWNKGANVYDDIIHTEFEKETVAEWSKILKQYVVPHKQKKKILDVGTGPGFFAILLAKMGHDVTAIDASSEMIKKAKKNAETHEQKIKFIHIDILEYDPMDTYDLIISRNVTWFLRNPIATYKKWFDWLNPNGVLNIFDANWNYYLTDKFAETLQQHAEKMALENGYQPYRDVDDVNEGNEISQTLPLSYVQRPQWDISVLNQLGFKELHIVFNVDENLNTNAEKYLNIYRKMFLIQGKKGE